MQAVEITKFVEQEVAACGLLENPYLRALRGGELGLDRFRVTQEQFFFAVSFFPRPMAALVGRIDSPKQRLDILHNLVEEHGEFNEEAFHHTTFQKFLASIGCDPDGLEGLTLWPCVRAFNSVLTCACVLDELEVGIGCMGAIEYAFADISRVVGNSVVDQGWVAADKLVHYRLHAEIDRKHADDFFAVIEPGWRDERKRYNIRQGVRMGVYIFDRLYRDLLEG